MLDPEAGASAGRVQVCSALEALHRARQVILVAVPESGDVAGQPHTAHVSIILVGLVVPEHRDVGWQAKAAARNSTRGLHRGDICRAVALRLLVGCHCVECHQRTSRSLLGAGIPALHIRLVHCKSHLHEHDPRNHCNELMTMPSMFRPACNLSQARGPEDQRTKYFGSRWCSQLIQRDTPGLGAIGVVPSLVAERCQR